MGTNPYQKLGGTVLRSDSANWRGAIPLLNLHFPSRLTLWRRAFPVHLTELDFAQLINFYVCLSGLGEFTLQSPIPRPYNLASW